MEGNSIRKRFLWGGERVRDRWGERGVVGGIVGPMFLSFLYYKTL